MKQALNVSNLFNAIPCWNRVAHISEWRDHKYSEPCIGAKIFYIHYIS